MKLAVGNDGRASARPFGQVAALSVVGGRGEIDYPEGVYRTNERRPGRDLLSDWRTRAVVENSPHLEAFKEKGYEVLYLTDPLDELLAQSLWDYEGKKLKSAGKGALKLGENQEEKEKAQEILKKKEEEAADLFAAMQKALDKHVKQVRLSNRLVASPACLVVAEMDYSPQMERLLQKAKAAGRNSVAF